MKSFLSCAVLAASIGLAMPANAAVLLGATKITISNAVPTWLQVGEVLAYEFGTYKDVAAHSNGGTASATAPYFDSLPAPYTGIDQYSPNSGPDKAIDGLFPAGFLDPTLPGYPGPNGVYHSAGQDGSDVLTVNFGATTLAGLTIYGRADSGFYARDLYNVSIFNGVGATLYSGQLDARTAGFASVSFVPEPAAWTMLMLGFGAIGWTLRGSRRQRGLAAAA